MKVYAIIDEDNDIKGIYLHESTADYFVLAAQAYSVYDLTVKEYEVDERNFETKEGK